MPTFAAFLRGVMPTNAKMPELKRAFESAGFTDVKTVLGSGNVVFTSRKSDIVKLQADAEAAMEKCMGRSFLTIVRPVDGLRKILMADPYAHFKVPAEAKRIATFMRDDPGRLPLPIDGDLARILVMREGVIFSYYLPNPKGPVFMTLLEKTLGKGQTTRTWQTLRIVASP
jgi:uncharacterized protein (DUF1697 family)